MGPFAPRESLFKRYLQTLAVVAMVFMQVISFLIVPLFVIYIIVYTKFWWICILYIAWYLIVDRDVSTTGRRRSEWVRSWIWWSYAKDYYPVKVVNAHSIELDPKRNYLFCYFPHGVLATCTFLSLATNVTNLQKLFPLHKAHIHTLKAFYLLPFIRELGATLGGMDVTKKALNYVLGKKEGGNISGLVVGGAQEAYYAISGMHKVVLRERRGFVKISLETGAPLVPVYCFGENELFSQIEFDENSIIQNLRELIRKILGFSVIFPIGRKDFLGLIPKRTPLTIVGNLLQRVLQTSALAFVIILQVITFICIPIFVTYIILSTKYWWICILYIAWYLTLDRDASKKAPRRSEWVRSWSLWSYAAAYFPIKVVKAQSVELDPKRNYLFCYFPHGVLAVGSSSNLASNATNFQKLFPHHKASIHAVTAFYNLPFLRELGNFLGGLDATREALEYNLGKKEGGNISGLVVGGVQEVYLSSPGMHKIILKKRKGFVKIALKTGAPLVPVYSFGENELYTLVDIDDKPILLKLREFMRKAFGIPIIIPIGRKDLLGLVPKRVPITVVVGDPIDVQKTENPTQEQIDNLHNLFEKKLVELFEEHKKFYVKDYENVHLEIL